MFVRIFTATRKLGSTAPQPSKTFFLQDSGPVRVVSLVTVSLGGERVADRCQRAGNKKRISNGVQMASS